MKANLSLMGLYFVMILSACFNLQIKNSLTQKKETPEELLLSAVSTSNISQVRILLDGGQIRNIDTANGQSLLKIAFDQFEFNIAALLLGRGADTGIQVMYQGRLISIVEYVFLRSINDTVGYHAVMIGLLLDHNLDIDQANLSQDFFMKILEKRVIPLSQRGDLLFTTWLTLLKNVFQKQCFEDGEYAKAYLEVCSDYVNRIHLFFEEAKRDQVVELNAGDFGLFMQDFDLCPQNKKLFFPGIQGCQ
jgi:hypothetical protein